MEIANELNVELTFPVKRVIFRKKQFDVGVSDEVQTSQSAEESFRVQFFLYIVDQALSSLNSRFQQFDEYENFFGFLYNVKKFGSTSDKQLKEHCLNFESYLKYDTRSDIDGNDLFLELKDLKWVLPNDIKNAFEVLNFLNVGSRQECYPQAWIAYRILLTIPVTVASNERSFSKLKLIKSYLRSTMSQERLNGLAMQSIEPDLVIEFNYNTMIANFASQCARRMI